MGVPKKYRNIRENRIASYDWTDISSGIGYIEFYGCQEQIVESGSQNDYGVLMTQAINSAVLTVRVDNGNYGKDGFSFETSEFNMPRVINGEVWISGGGKENGNSGGDDLYLEMKKIKTDDSEESLGSVVVGKWGGSEERNFFGRITISNHKIKQGEKLKLVLDATKGSDTSDITIGTSPIDKNPKNWTDTTSQLKIAIPFNINL